MIYRSDARDITRSIKKVEEMQEFILGHLCGLAGKEKLESMHRSEAKRELLDRITRLEENKLLFGTPRQGECTPAQMQEAERKLEMLHNQYQAMLQENDNATER